MNCRNIIVALCANLAAAGAVHAQASFAGGSGVYAGGSIGGAQANMRTSASSSNRAASYFITTDFGQIASAGEGAMSGSKVSGAVFGGYERRFGSLLAGVEASAHSLSLNQSRSASAVYLSAAPSRFNLQQTLKADWEVTLRGRLGLVHKQWLGYVTAGAAFTRATYSTQFNDNFNAGARGSASTSKTLVGWTVGVGSEYAISRNLALRGEYLYADFGNINNTAVVTNPSNAGLSNNLDSSARLRTHLVSVGLAYRF